MKNKPEDIVQLFKAKGLHSALDIIAQEDFNSELCSNVMAKAIPANCNDLVEALVDKVDFDNDDAFESLHTAISSSNDEAFEIILSKAPENAKSYALGMAVLYDPSSPFIQTLLDEVSSHDCLEYVAISSMSTMNKEVTRKIISKIDDQECLHRLFSFACQGKSLFMSWILPKLENPKENILINALSACESVSEPSLVLLMPHISDKDAQEIKSLLPQRGMWSKHERLFSSVRKDYLDMSMDVDIEPSNKSLKMKV